jgi:hypothetical protein
MSPRARASIDLGCRCRPAAANVALLHDDCCVQNLVLGNDAGLLVAAERS